MLCSTQPVSREQFFEARQALALSGPFLGSVEEVGVLIAICDRFTRSKWAGLLEPRDLQSIRPRDFEMVEAGARIPLTLDCVRNP